MGESVFKTFPIDPLHLRNIQLVSEKVTTGKTGLWQPSASLPPWPCRLARGAARGPPARSVDPGSQGRRLALFSFGCNGGCCCCCRCCCFVKSFQFAGITLWCCCLSATMFVRVARAATGGKAKLLAICFQAIHLVVEPRGSGRRVALHHCPVVLGSVHLVAPWQKMPFYPKNKTSCCSPYARCSTPIFLNLA